MSDPVQFLAEVGEDVAAVEVFHLATSEDVQKFENLLHQYCESTAQLSLRQISLVRAYDFCSQLGNGQRVFAALVDVQLNLMLVYLDVHKVGATWNANFSIGKLEGGTVLDSMPKFSGKLEIHRYLSSFIFRYRALWDKIMGLLILVQSPNDYDRFICAKSKKRTFSKIAERTPGVLQEFATIVNEHLTNFDDKFRTAEAHGTGSLRKWSFTMQSLGDNPQIELLGYWNALLACIRQVGSLVGKDDDAATESTK